MNREIRGRARYALSMILTSKKNISIIEQLIFTKYSEERMNISEYNSLIYQSIGICQTHDIKDAIRLIRDGKFYFEKHVYNRHYEKRKQIIEYMNKRPEIEEGVAECSRCKSKRVLSMQKQIRRADEGSTTFNVCQQCEFKWTSNN